MNNSPGWASPGSSPSDPEEPEQPSDDQADAASGDAPANWSRNQPPASPGWGSLPSRGPQEPRGADSGSPGWYGRPLPPAAKPGVVPLRPLAVGEILEGAIGTIRLHWRTVLGISFIVALLTQGVSTLVTGLFLKNPSVSLTALQDNPNPSLSDLRHTLSSMFAGSGISVLGQLVAGAMLTIIVSRSVLGRPVSAGDAWRESSPRFLRLAGMTVAVSLIAVIVVGIGAAPGILLLAVFGSATGGVTLALLGGFAGMIVAVWLIIRLCLAMPALVLEKQGVFASLARSAKLVHGAWWRIFGVHLLASLIVVIITSMITVPFTAIGTLVGGNGAQTLLVNGGTPTSWPFLIVTGIGTVIGATIAVPLITGVTTLLYVDQRIRREGLDIELARAAGVPGY